MVQKGEGYESGYCCGIFLDDFHGWYHDVHGVRYGLG
jgi:hypothetical protein